MIARIACAFLVLLVGCADPADPPPVQDDTESCPDEIRMRGGVSVALQIKALDRDELVLLASIVDIPVQDESEATEIAQSLVSKAAESPELVRRALIKMKNQHDTMK